MPLLQRIWLLATTVPWFVTCSAPPDPAVLRALTEGAWHGSLGAYDYVLMFRTEGEQLTGISHQIEGRRQRTAMEMTKVSLSGASLQIDYANIPPYHGVVDLAAGRILGGHPDAAAFEQLNLRRAEPADWPMIAPRSPADLTNPASLWNPPVQLRDGWETTTPREVGLDPELIQGVLEDIVGGKAGWLHSLLMARHGDLVVEEYFHGWEAGDLHRLASCTKSVSSLLVGIAIDHGWIEGVEAPLLDFFPEQRAEAGEGWDALRLEHLLTMSMGLDWSDREAEGFSPSGQDRFLDVLRRKVVNPPGSRFRYVSRNTNLLSKILLEATGSQADELAAEYLFAPMGIESWDWDRNRYQGHPDMTGTLRLRPRDMLKLGQLILNDGSWQGSPVVSAEWVQESTRHRITSPNGEEYGYLWWRFDEPEPGVDFASGIGSQYIFAIPAYDLVVATTGANDYSPDRQSAIIRLLRSRLQASLSR